MLICFCFFTAPIHDLVATKKSEEVQFYLPQRHVLDVELGGKVSILRGNLVRFSCPIVEKANVDIGWYNNLEQVYNGEKYHIEGRTLQLKDSSEIGTYNITCQIYGPIGSTSVTSQLVIVGKYFQVKFRVDWKVTLVCNEM